MQNFWRLISYLKPYKGRFALSFTLAMITIGNDLLVPMLFGWTISKGLESGRIDQVILYAGLLVAGPGCQIGRELCPMDSAAPGGPERGARPA